MRHLLLLLSLVLACSSCWSAEEAKPGKAPTFPATATPEQQAATKAAVENAWKVMDELRATQHADIEAGLTHAKGDTPSSIKAKEFAKAHHDALTAFFSEPQNTDPLEIDPKLPNDDQARLKKLNIQLSAARSGARNGLADIFASLGDPNQAQEMGMAYGKEKHLDWLVDICDGGRKRYENDKYSQEAKAKLERREPATPKKKDPKPKR